MLRGSGKRQRLLQPRQADKEAATSCCSLWCPGTGRSSLCHFFVQCNSSPILQTKELKMEEKALGK